MKSLPAGNVDRAMMRCGRGVNFSRKSTSVN